MPNKKKLYDALVQEGYKDFENEEAFNTYVDNADNRKTLFNALKQVGYDIESEKAFDNYLGYSEPQIKGERINNTISGGVGTQEEADAIFEANAKAVREKYNGKSQSPSWGVPNYDWRTDKQKQFDAFSQDNQATVVRDRQGNEYYPIKPMEVAYDEAMKEVSAPTPLDIQIEDRLKANEEALKKAYEKNKPFFANPGVGIGRAYSTSALTVGDSDEIKDLKAEKEYLKNAKAVLNAARNDAGFFAGMKDAVQKASFMDFGVSDLINAQRISEVQQKLDSGIPLSESEQNLLSSLGLQQTIEQQYNDMLGSWYKAGMTTADMAPFMLEMVANPVSSLGKAAMKAAVKKFGEKGAKAVAAKVLSRTIGDVAGAAAMAGTTGLAGTSADALERQQGYVTTGVDENGNLIGTGLEGGNDSSTAWRKAFTARTIENWSEMVGQYFEPVGKVLGKGAKKGLEKIGLSKVNDFIDNVNSSEWARTLDDFTEQTQWNGSLGEFGEEQVGMVADALLVGDTKWKDLVDAEKQLDTALGVGVFGTAMSLLRIGGYRTPKYRARKAVENADKNGLEAFGIEQWNLIKGSIDGSETDKQTISNLSSVFGSDATDEQKKAAFEYVNALKAQQAVNTIKEKDKIDNPGNVAVATESAYDEGSELKEPSAKHKAKLELDKAETAIADDAELSALVVAGVENPVDAVNSMRNQGFTEERIQKAKDYFTAYKRMSGLTDELIDRVDSQIENTNKEVDANTWHDSNTQETKIVPVSFDDGRSGYVIEGNIVLDVDGRVDAKDSDPVVKIRFSDGFEAGIKSGDIKLHGKIGQITTPESLKEYNSTSLKEQLINNEIGEIDWNPATPNPKIGDSFEMDGVPVTIVSHDGQGGMFVVPTEQWQAAQGNEKQMQKLMMQAQQAGSVPASMFKQWASDQLDSQEEAVAVQQEAAIQESVSTEIKPAEEPAANEEAVSEKKPMSEDEAAMFIFQMERNAMEAPEIELTPENWIAEFGEDGLVDTPVGQVKFGQNQYVKLQQMGRNGKLGMIKPTLTNPDVIIEDKRPSKNGSEERDFSYVFIKAFTGKGGKRMYYFTSVTVKKGGSEVVISNQEKSVNKISRLLQNGNVVWTNSLFSSHPTTQIEKSVSLNDSNKPTSTDNQPALLGINSSELSVNKDSDKNVQSQEKQQKPFHERKKEDVFRELGEMYGEKMPHKVEVTAKALAEDVINAQQAVEKAQQALDNAPIGRDSKQKKALEKAQNELMAIQTEADFWAEMDADIKAAQARRDEMLNPKVEANMSEDPISADEFVAQQLSNGNIALTSESFKKETGYGEAERKKFIKIIRKAENGGMAIEEAGERLMEMDRENGTNFFDQSDPNAGRDAIINMLGMARTWGDITNYIRNNRQRQAEADAEGIRSEMEEAIWNAYHVTPEEYVTMLEMELQENPYEGIDLAALDAIFAEKEFGEEQKSEEYESGTDVEGNQGQSELLSEERAGDTAGNQPGETVEQAEGFGSGTQVEGEAAQAGTSVSRGINVFAETERIDKEEQRRKPLRERAREWSKALGVKVNLLESINDVDAKTRAQIEKAHANGDDVPGWVAPNGEVYFFIPDIHELKDVDDTYIHEVVAHVGLPQLLGEERFGELCDKVWEMMPQSEKAYYYNYPGVDNINDSTEKGRIKRERRAADEFIAHISESVDLTPEEKTIWDNIVQFFREALDKALNGIIGKSRITNADIANLIKASYANLKSEAGNVAGQIEKAREEVDQNPTEAQKEAGNYKKGHIKIDGYDITIENPKGGVRSGTDKNGKEWSITMNNDYGYIRGTEAVDGDHIDVFLSDNPTEGNVFVVDQSNEDGSFDESKVMYGFNSLEEARAAYLSNYEKSWESRIMAITEVSKEEFKKWIDSSHRKTKAFSEYKSVKITPSIEETNVSRMSDIEERLAGIEGERIEIEDQLNELGNSNPIASADLISSLYKLDREQADLESEYSGLRAMNDESNAILEEEGSELRFSAKKKRALETASVSKGKHQPTVVSNADGAKILNNLDNLQKEYEEKSSQSKTFLGDVAKAIEARKQGSGSQYAIFETVNGKVVTIRLADHNATVSNFDNRDENEGISIVVSAKDNNGITNDGYAHIVEYFYDSIDLRRADGKPLAEIVKSIKQSLYSGEYKDTTGLAERQEVNESRFRVVNDKNGKKTLVGLHNISEEKLKKAIKQGGLANPSMAVIDMDKQSHVDYGDITLVAPESLVDKKLGKNVGTYMADAYTPVYPTVAKKLSDKGGKALTKALESVDETFRSKVRTYFNSYLDTGTPYDALAYWYLSDTGKNPPILEAALPEGFTKEEVEKVKSINSDADSFFQLSEDEKQKALSLYADKFFKGIKEYEEHLADYTKRMQEVVQDESKPQFVRKNIQQNLNAIERYGYEYDRVAGYYNRAVFLASRQSKPSDFETFRNAFDEVSKNGLEEDFGNWMTAKETELGVEEKLFAGYDNQGRAKYLPNTLENASKLMKKEGRAGATGLGGFNYFVAILAPAAKTTKEINKKKGNLSTQEEYDEFSKKWGEYYHDLALQLQPGADKWADYGYHRLHEIAPMSNPKDYVKREYGIELSDKFIKDLNEVKTAIKNDFPARYFETKFERPVYLNEFAAAVVPQGTSKDVVDALTDAGLPVEEYEKDNNEARMAAVDKVSSETEGVRFRRVYHGSGASFDKFDHSYMSTGEGNQAYGWGTYVTDVEGIGKQYAGLYAKNSPLAANTLRWMEENGTYEDFLAQGEGKRRNYAIRHAKDFLKELKEDGASEDVIKAYEQDLRDAEDALSEENYNRTKENMVASLNRNLYTVDIPDNNGTNYIEWDKPLSEENKKRIKDAVLNSQMYKDYAAKYGEDVSLERLNSWMNAFDAGRVYRLLENFADNDDSQESAKAVSMLLSDAGYVGFEYPANFMSGGNENGEKNYVIFNEDDLKIVEHTRFRLSDKGRKIQNEVDKFTAKYNSKEVVFVDSEMTDEELEDAVPESTAKRTREEISSGYPGGYSPNTDKIYIFVDNQELDDVENTMFHENLHSMFNDTPIVEEYFENAKNVQKAAVDTLSENYGEHEAPNELFAYSVSNDMVDGTFKFVKKYLSDLSKEEFFNKIKEFGYDREKESSRRDLVSKGRGAGRLGTVENDTEPYKSKEGIRQIPDQTPIKGSGLDEGKRSANSGPETVLEEGIRGIRERAERLGDLFDQVADMGLDGVLGNKAYEKLLMDIYNEIPEKDRITIDSDADSRYNGNLFPAISDYVNHAEPTIIDRIVSIVREALRKAGFDMELSSNDVKYMLWRSRKRLNRNNILDVAEDIDALRRFGTSDNTTRFSIKKKKENFDVSDKRDKLLKEYDAFLKTGKFNFIEAFQDRMYSLKVLMDKVVEATGKKVRDYEDAYKAENQLGSINKPMQEKYLKNFYKPLLEAVEELFDKYGREVVERYIYCKSGLERNVVLRQRDADEAYNSSKAELDEKLAKNEIDQAQYNILLQQAEDQRNKTLSEDVDYSGIRGMLFNSKAQDIQKEYEDGKIDKDTRDARLNNLEANRSTATKDWKKFAENQVNALESKASGSELDSLWGRINAATNETLRMDYESDMIDKETYDAEKNMMKYYVPLRNWDDTTAEEMYEYRSELVRPVSSNQKRAKGRESQADNPIATIAIMAQSAIVRGNRNKMKQKFYAFVANRETSLATVRDVWYVKDPSTGNWVPQYADTSSAKNSAEFDAIISQFEEDMKLLEEQGQAFRGKLPLGMKFKASASQKKAHVVPVMIDGKEYAVYVNGNPRAAQAINGETNAESVKDGYEWLDQMKRFYGAGLTSWNPDFIAPNLVRDTIHASTMTMLDSGPMAAIKYMFNAPKMFWNVGKLVTGVGKADPKLEAYFQEFVDNGGETGYTAIHTLEDYKKEYDRLLGEMKGVKTSIAKGGKKSIEKLASILEAANRIAEDTNRFNAYVSARESGESIMRSVDAAKNITVNFNRKGALNANNTVWGKVASAMSRWILFFNPAVQGIDMLVSKSKANPKRATAMGVTILSSGLMMPMLNEMLVSAFGDDDEDDYWNQSDYKRRNNWMLFTGNGYISIPLPPVLRELYGIGDIVYGTITGHITPERAAMDIARQVQSAIGFFNLIPEVSQEPDLVTYAKGFAPDIAAPFLDVITNTNFMGRPIAKWTDFNEYDPEYERVYKGTSKHWVELSKLLNEVGGNEGRRSDTWGNFINPAMMEHLFTSYGGGIGKTVNNLAGMITDAIMGDKENIDPFRKSPILPRFYTPNDEKTVVPAINRKFYDYNYRYNVAKKAMKDYKEGVQSGEHPEWQKYIDEMKENGEREFIKYFEDAEKRVKKIQNRLKGNPPNKEQLEKTLIDVKAQIAADCYEMMK